jgi:DNA-binding CsgD family transcriptional regulator/DNA-binding MarR family transcriptional regulator
MLEHLGLTADEEAAYRAVVEEPATHAALRRRLGLSAREVTDVTARLDRLGLVTSSDGGVWSAVPPDVALVRLQRGREDEVARQARSVEEGRAALAQFLLSVPQYGSDSARRLVEVVDGFEEVGRRALQVTETARESIRVLDRPPYVYNTPESGSTLDLELRLLKAGVTYRVIYDAESFTPPELSECFAESLAAGERARVLAEVPVKLCIADNDVAILPLVPGPGQPGRAVVLHTPVMVEPFAALFESLWSRAIPVGPESGGAETAPGDEPGPDERALVMLLAAGMKDGAIARHLRVSERTVNRRIADLIDRLDAHTRFQAGAQATRRGWL